MMTQRLSHYAASFLLATASHLVCAESSALRSYTLPDHGSLQLIVPKSWHEEVRRPPNRLPPTIVFTPRSGAAFQILLTPIYFGAGDTLPTASVLKAEVGSAQEASRNVAVEKDLPLQELTGMSVTGYYFSLTDKAPKENEYKYMTQGIMRVGMLAPTFTILTNDDSRSVAEEGLAVMKSAVHVQSTP